MIEQEQERNLGSLSRLLCLYGNTQYFYIPRFFSTPDPTVGKTSEFFLYKIHFRDFCVALKKMLRGSSKFIAHLTSE